MQQKNRFFMRLLVTALIALSAGACKHQEQQAVSPARSIHVKIVAGEELATPLGPLNESFIASNPRLADGSRVTTELIIEDNLKAAQRIATGDLKSHAWIPPSSSLINFANQNRFNLGPEQSDCSSLFETPIVVALRERYVKQLDPASTGKIKLLSFFKIPDLPSLAGGWSAVSVLHAHPLHSLTGYLAMNELAYLAAEGKSLSASLLADQDFQNTFARYSTHIGAYPLSDELMLQKVLTSNGSKINLAITTEQMVKRFNATATVEELQTLTPEDGQGSSEYSLCLSKADWVTPAHDAALRMFKTYLGSKEALNSFEKAGFRVHHFETERNDSARTAALPGEVVTAFVKNWSHYRRPYAILAIIDTSPGMAGDSLDAGKKFLRQIFELKTPNDVAAIVGFGSEAKIISGFTNNKISLTKSLEQLQPSSGSSLRKALEKTLQLARQPEGKGRLKKVILFTDAADKSSFELVKSFLTSAGKENAAGDFDISVVVLEQPDTDRQSFEELLGQRHSEQAELTAPLDLDAVFNELLKGF